MNLVEVSPELFIHYPQTSTTCLMMSLARISLARISLATIQKSGKVERKRSLTNFHYDKTGK